MMDIEVIINDSIKQEMDYHDLLENSIRLVRFIKNSTVRNNIFLNKVKYEFSNEK